MKNIISIIIAIIGIALGIYVGGWLMFIKPIIACCTALDAGTLTAAMVGWTIVKCIFASAVGTIIAYIGIVIASLINK